MGSRNRSQNHPRGVGTAIDGTEQRPTAPHFPLAKRPDIAVEPKDPRMPSDDVARVLDLDSQGRREWNANPHPPDSREALSYELEVMRRDTLRYQRRTRGYMEAVLIVGVVLHLMTLMYCLRMLFR